MSVQQILDPKLAHRFQSKKKTIAKSQQDFLVNKKTVQNRINNPLPPWKNDKKTVELA